MPRRLLLLPAAALVTGAVIILHAPIPPALQVISLCCWLPLQGRELYRFASESARFTTLRFSGHGGFMARQKDGQWRAVSLRSGCVARPAYVWLRIRTREGQQWDTLLLRTRVAARVWRRLHVCLRFQQ